MNKLLLMGLFLMSQIVLAKDPKLSFFNEQDGKDLQVLFSDSTLVHQLQQLNAEIRMGMLDLSPERAEVLKMLNKANIPVVAWLLLPKEKGYWFHSGNAQEAFDRYQEVKQWGENNGINFSGIGIDLELDMNDLDLIESNKLKLVGKVLGRLYSKNKFLEAKAKYNQLIEQIRSDGYSIESYYVPFIKYEEEKGRTSLQQASGFMDLETDKDIPMLYTSFMGNAYGTLKVLALDEGLEYVAIGSTGGGFDPTMPSMDWESLAYDLRLSSKTAKEIHIFCLEAAVEKGFIDKMIGFDFDVPITEYPEQAEVTQKQVNTVMTISSILSYPTLMILVVLILISGVIYLLYRILKRVSSAFKKP